MTDREKDLQLFNDAFLQAIDLAGRLEDTIEITIRAGKLLQVDGEIASRLDIVLAKVTDVIGSLMDLEDVDILQGAENRAAALQKERDYMLNKIAQYKGEQQC